MSACIFNRFIWNHGHRLVLAPPSWQYHCGCFLTNCARKKSSRPLSPNEPPTRRATITGLNRRVNDPVGQCAGGSCSQHWAHQKAEKHSSIRYWERVSIWSIASVESKVQVQWALSDFVSKLLMPRNDRSHMHNHDFWWVLLPLSSNATATITRNLTLLVAATLGQQTSRQADNLDLVGLELIEPVTDCASVRTAC